MTDIKPAGSEDSDLADLIGENGSSAEKEPLANGGGNAQNPNICSTLCKCVYAHISYYCFAYPKFCGTLLCMLTTVLAGFGIAYMINPNSEYGVVGHDWTSVNSAYELDVGKIDHWCLGGGNEGCRWFVCSCGCFAACDVLRCVAF